MHREKRKFLRTTLKELGVVFTDQPGLLGPKVGFVNFYFAAIIDLNMHNIWKTVLDS